jgi:phosphoglycolate phosphatase
VGDSPVDLAAARAAGLPVILVSFGYTAVPARDLGADHVVDSLSEIPRLVAR